MNVPESDSLNQPDELSRQTARALSGVELVVSLALSTVVFWVMELEKWLLRRR